MADFIKGIKITVTGETVPVQIDAKDRLQALYKEIDCTTVEYLGAEANIDLIIDEEGKLTGKEPNNLATIRAIQLGVRLLPGDVICGDVIFLGHDGEGATIGLNEEQLMILEVLEIAC
ncbi:DUF3846 domain-containing protein [Glutamicibacter arilaitensis]|uniref:DUF3846 domain-containing protein n=1 Tax=Glutamicibacter arilaitensis TaxID=256701 RepID=UPI003FD0B4CB